MEHKTQYLEEDKINLRELFAVLKRRKKLIWSVTGILTLLAIVYAFLIAKPVYEVKTMIEIGQINDKPIDNINNIQQKLSYEYQINVKGKKRELPRVDSISAPKKSNSILALNIHGYSNEEAVNFIQTVINNIEEKYQEKTKAYTNSQKELIKLIQEDLKENSSNLQVMKNELRAYSQKIVSLKSEDAALAGIYALQIGQKQTQLQELRKYISELKNEEQKLKLSITPLMIKPTQIIGDIETLENPVKPKKKLIVIVAFITGLMLSVFLAFFLEFFKALRNEDSIAQ